MKILVTGTAGFIGFHEAKRLIDRGDTVVGLDIINDYYDINLKYNRLKDTGIDKESVEYGKLIQSTKHDNYSFIKLDLNDKEGMDKLFKEQTFERVCHLAAQAGVRYSLTNPEAYIESNISGFLNVLESCRHNSVGHLTYASSSSVYGANESLPFSTSDNIDHPISLYAASKKSNELMAHVYSHLFKIPTTGLRFFTVYGPWGRPDMALFIFTKAILEDKSIPVFNYGNMLRDFTYVDDIVEGITRVLDNPPKGKPEWDGKNPDPSTSKAPFKIYNIGNNAPVKLMSFIEAIENKLGKKAEKEMLPLQAGDVPKTYANVQDLIDDLGYKPSTDIQTGIDSFIEWYLDYFKK